MSEQLIHYGLVIGFDEHNKDFALVTDGFYTLPAFIPFTSPEVQVGKSYSLYKQGSTYFLGTEVQTL